MELGVDLGVDFLLQSAEDEPVAAVQVKNRLHLSSQIAAQFWPSFADAPFLRRIPFLMLVSQDYGYLWVRREGENALPDYEFPMAPVIQRYAPDLLSTDRMGAYELELLVMQWLYQLIDLLDRPTDEPEATLERAGLLRAIRGGRLSVPGLRELS